MNTPNYSQIKIAKGSFLGKLKGLTDKVFGHFERIDYKVNKAVDAAVTSVLQGLNAENQKVLKLLGKVVSKDGDKTKDHEALFPYVQSIAKATSEFIDLTQDNMRAVRDQYKGRQDFRKKDIHTMEGRSRSAISVLTSFNEKLRRNKKTFSVPDALKEEFDRIVQLSHIETAKELQLFFKGHNDLKKLQLEISRFLNEAWLRKFRDTDALNFNSLEDTLDQLVRWAESATQPNVATRNIIMFKASATPPPLPGTKTPAQQRAAPHPPPLPGKAVPAKPTGSPAAQMAQKTLENIRNAISSLKKELDASKRVVEGLQEKVNRLKDAGDNGIEHLRAKAELGRRTAEYLTLTVKYYDAQIQALIRIIDESTAAEVPANQKKLIGDICRILISEVKRLNSHKVSYEDALEKIRGGVEKYDKTISEESSKSVEDYSLGKITDIGASSKQVVVAMKKRVDRMLAYLNKLPGKLDIMLERMDQIDDKIRPVLNYMSQSKMRQYINMPSLNRKDIMKELGWSESSLARMALRPEDLDKKKLGRTQQVKGVKKAAEDFAARLQKFLNTFSSERFMKDVSVHKPLEQYKT